MSSSAASGSQISRIKRESTSYQDPDSEDDDDIVFPSPRKPGRRARKYFPVFQDDDSSPEAELPVIQDDGNSPDAKLAVLKPAPAESVLVGFWIDSISPLDIDKHAVYGRITQYDKLQLFVVKQTRDRREVVGNFPQGMEEFSIPFEKVDTEQHIAKISLEDVEGYVRRRLRLNNPGKTGSLSETARREGASSSAEAHGPAQPISGDESPTQAVPVRLSSRLEAMRAARAKAFVRAESLRRRWLNGHSREKSAAQSADIPDRSRSADGASRHRIPIQNLLRTESPTERQVPHSEPTRKRRGSDGSEFFANQAKRARPARRATVHRAVERSSSSRSNAVSAESTKSPDRLERDGVKYERKGEGLFDGKLVGDRKEMFSIDGEDYVEVRVLVKLQKAKL